MALLQISEPGQSSAPHQHKLAIGIDLGTTNSLVASVKSGESVILKDENNNAILPSVVHCGDNNKLTVGCDACPYAKTDPTNTIISVKR
ncbi:Hsp70 family protein, partial [Candidatus Thioglobus sp.]